MSIMSTSRAHTAIIDLEFLRLHDPDEHWELFNRLVRLGEGKVYLTWDDDLNDFLDGDEIGKAWRSCLNSRYGFLEIDAHEIQCISQEDELGLGKKSNVVLAAGGKLKSWAVRQGLPAYSSLVELSKVSRRRPFEERWKHSKKSILLGRKKDECSSWREVLDGPASRLKPSCFNAAMLLDMHLFNDRSLVHLLNGGTCSGLKNLQDLLRGLGDAFCPQKLILCFGVMAHLNPKRFERVKNFKKLRGAFFEKSRDRHVPFCLNQKGMCKMHEVLKMELLNAGYTGELELVGMRQKGPELYFREFMTNHHLLSSDKGFDVFHKSRIDQGDLSMKCLLHDLEWEDDELDSELVVQWRVNLEVMRDVLRKRPHCVGVNGEVCDPSDLGHPFVLPLRRAECFHDQ